MHFSPRQRQILRLIALGKTDKEIAYEIGIAENTVGISLFRFRQGIRLVGSNRAHLVALALRERIVTLAELYAALSSIEHR